MDYYDYEFIEVNYNNWPLCVATKYSENNEISSVDESESSSYYNYNPTYEVTLYNSALFETKKIRAKEYTLEGKIEATFKRWADLEEKQRKLDAAYDSEFKATQMTAYAESKLDEITEILKNALIYNSGLNWDSLKNLKEYTIAKPEAPNYQIKYPYPLYPEKKPHREFKEEPNINAYHYIPKFTLLEKVFKSKKEEKIALYKKYFEDDYNKWVEDCKRVESYNSVIDDKYDKEIVEYNKVLETIDETRENARKRHEKKVANWISNKETYYKNKEKTNKIVEQTKASYLGGDATAIVKYYQALLEQSEYPELYDKIFHVEYLSDKKQIVVDYLLPIYSTLPSIKEYKFIKSRNEITEKHRSNVEMSRIFEDVCYQLALRTVYEVFNADSINAVESIAFNGISKEIDLSTGVYRETCILSIEVGKEDFSKINLRNIDYKACFKDALNGRSGAKLTSFTEIKPFVKSSKKKEFRRQLESRIELKGGIVLDGQIYPNIKTSDDL